MPSFWVDFGGMLFLFSPLSTYLFTFRTWSSSCGGWGKKGKGGECEDKKRVELVLVLMFSLSLCVVLECMGGIPLDVLSMNFLITK